MTQYASLYILVSTYVCMQIYIPVVKVYAHSVVAPAIDYWKVTMDIKNVAEVVRFKVARIFNPLHVCGQPNFS